MRNMETMMTSHDIPVVMDGSSSSGTTRRGTILYNLLAQPLDRISRKRSSPQLSTSFQMTVPGHHPLQTDFGGSCEGFNGTVRRQSMPVVPTVQWLGAPGATQGALFTAVASSSSLASSSSSLTSGDSVGGRSNGGNGGGSAGGFSEALVEVARVRLGRLSTADQEEKDQQTQEVDVDVDDDGQDAVCDRQQATAPVQMSPPEPRRKHSEASRMAGLIRRVAARQQQQQQQRQVAASDVTAHKRLRCDVPVDEGFDDYDGTDSTSSAAARGRSYTLPVCGDQGLNNMRRTACRAQPVTLAKKMQLPVTGRVAELLRKTVDFARSLPEFQGLSLSDRVALLSNACPRLLLLYMAEVNLQFAVTVVRDEEQVRDVTAGAAAAAAAGARSVQPTAAAVTPTMQFADTVQSFLAKCQKLEISNSEYFYMRLIALFHTGCKTIENIDAVNRVYTEARQDLQDLSLHQRPTERLRYSTLLLTLHTLFSVHCGMLYTLLCPQQQQQQHDNNDSTSGFHSYISRQLRPTQ